MKTIISEDMRWRKKMCDFALSQGVTKAARRYKVNRMFIYRNLKKYKDEDARSLAMLSRKPKSHPKAHKEKELKLIIEVYKIFKDDGLAEVFIQSKKKGYKRSFSSMCRQIRKLAIGEKSVKEKKTSGQRKYYEVRGRFPGDKVQVDIKYVPQRCLGFNTYGRNFYQVTSIDEYSRKRVLEIVDEKTPFNLARFVKGLQEKMGFRIRTIQTDNGAEFTDSTGRSKRKTLFETALDDLQIIHRKTAPYSPWQNGKVERSHRLDNKRFYNKYVFRSSSDLKACLKLYNMRYNDIAKKVLGFKNPNQIVQEYFTQVN